MYSDILTSNKYEYSRNDKSVIDNCLKDIAIGNKDSLVLLYEITRVSVYSFALSILKNIHEAEDVLQEVYIKIYENACSYQNNGKPMAWILTITKNLSLMKLRSKKHTVDIDEIIEILPSKDDKDNSLNKLILSAAFKYITDEERNILMLHVISGYKHREISKMLNIPLSTVLSKYNRCIRKIRKIINEEEKYEKKRNLEKIK